MSSPAREVPFNTTGWQTAGPNRWRKGQGGELALTSATAMELRNESRFRDVVRQEVLRRGGGLVSADLVLSGGSRVGRVIAKFPQQPTGMTYEGWLLYERAGATHRVTVRVPEVGITGVRDALIFGSWSKDRPDDDLMEGWMLDPHDTSRRDPLMKNVADDRQYDVKFPEHPLSVVRVELAAIESSLRL